MKKRVLVIGGGLAPVLWLQSLQHVMELPFLFWNIRIKSAKIITDRKR